MIDSGPVSTASDILQILGEMSWDTLFVIVGLAFVALAILGDISGKISPGKTGRIAAAFVGAGLIGSGLWYHNALHGFEITGVDVAAISPPPSGPCPSQIALQGILDARGSGNAIYYFEFSNGNASPAATSSFQQTNAMIVPGTWQLHASLTDGWVRLHVIAPSHKASGKSNLFSVACLPAVQVSPGVAHTPASTPESPMIQAPAAAPQANTSESSTNNVELNSISPPSGTYLKRGQPVLFAITVTYNLATADSAILSISTAQLRASPARCSSGGSAELVDAVEVPIEHGQHRVQAHLTWSGDTGAATKGRVYGSGYLSFSPMFWASNNGARGLRLNFFGIASQYCYQFGP